MKEVKFQHAALISHVSPAQANPAFYASLFALENNVRCLQHHCRSALRKHFGKDCHALIPRLPIPNLLKSYLLLDPEGVVY